MSPGSLKVSDPALDEAALLAQRPSWSRLDVAPFAVLYICLYGVYLQCARGSFTELQVLCIFGAGLVVHAFTVLSSNWSVRFRAKVGYTRVSRLPTASHVLVVPKENYGRGAIVVLRAPRGESGGSVQVFGSNFALDEPTLDFQSARYMVQDNGRVLQRLDYPSSACVSDLRSWMGYADSRECIKAASRWGRNVCDIPEAEFFELFLEQATAPFFLFQIFCVLLWSLDNYWLYSFFTLLMLVIFEATVTLNRMQSLSTLRDMRKPSSVVYVFRAKRWILISSDELLPGDVISVGTSVSQRRRSDLPVPADVLLLSGSCVVNEAMLTGESVPQLKEALPDLDPKEVLDFAEPSQSKLQRNVLLGGTNILQSNPGSYGIFTPKAGMEKRAASIPAPPDKGCTALVLKSGFGSAQGNLTLTLMFASERVSNTSRESIVFICVLIAVALCAAVFVLRSGWKDERRNKYRLVLHCIMLVTSVVPPELPIELSLAVTNSLQKLMKAYIYCTEPFRIPLAGRIDICAFDKTGTLTSDRMKCIGVAGLSTIGAGEASASDGSTEEVFSQDVTELGDIPVITATTLASCQSLSSIKGELIGDPLEIATFENLGWKLTNLRGTGSSAIGMVVVPPKAKYKIGPVRIVKRHPFNSDLKRMSVIAHVPSVEGNSAESKSEMTSTPGGMYCFTKGAPEVIREFLANVPESYDSTYLHFMSKGYRVLALAMRQLRECQALELDEASKSRNEVETDLKFCGFLLLTSTLKDDTVATLEHIQDARYKCIMITGDGPLTAAEVARQCGILKHPPNETLALQKTDNGLVWRTLTASSRENSVEIEFKNTASAMDDISATHGMVVTGAALEVLLSSKSDKSSASSSIQMLGQRATVFARVIPAHKEAIIHALNESNYFTLMCGDGSNDVGALKRAHCGVSIISSPDLEDRLSRRVENLLGPPPQAAKKKSSAAQAKGGRKPKTKGTRASSSREQQVPVEDDPKISLPPPMDLDRATKLMLEVTETECDPTLVNLGDASIASPFTARRISIDCVRTVLLQGRCTLVTTMQVYKILALNCLVNAFMMSFLYLVGIKEGDTQMTLVGMLIAGLFFAISRAEPAETLCAQRPPASIFAVSVCLSVVLQSAIHLAAIFSVVSLNVQLPNSVEEYTPDEPFRPSPFNGTVFLLSAFQVVTTFVANYRGEPFMQAIQKHTLLLYIALGSYAVLSVTVLGFPVFTQLLEVPHFTAGAGLPIGVRIPLLAIMIADALLSIGVEYGCRMLE